MQDSIVDGWQKLHRNGTQNVAIVTGGSNLLFLRILIEPLLPIQRGVVDCKGWRIQLEKRDGKNDLWFLFGVVLNSILPSWTMLP